MTTPVTFQADITGDSAFETIVFDPANHTVTVDSLLTAVKVLSGGTSQIFAPHTRGAKILTIAADAASATLDEIVYGTCYKTDFGLPEGRYDNNLPTPTTHADPVTIYPSN